MQTILAKISKSSLAIFLLIFIALATSCSRTREVSIIVRETQKTPGVKVEIENIAENTRLLSVSTDSDGYFSYKLFAKSGQYLRITFDKTNYEISPQEYVFTIDDIQNDLLEIEIRATAKGKVVTFVVHNEIPDVAIRATKPTGDQVLLGKSDQRGTLTARFDENSYPSLELDFSILGGLIILNNPNHALPVLYHELPDTIGMSVIPEKALEFYFETVDKAGTGIVPDATILSAAHSIMINTDAKGAAKTKIMPSEIGPFIGDRITWESRKARHEVLGSVESRVTLGQFKYPADGVKNPYKIRLTEQFVIYFQVLEGRTPLANTVLLFNGKQSDPADARGRIVYEYDNDSVGKNLALSVPKNSGLSLNMASSSIKLGMDDQSLKLQMQTIHAILKIVDEKTGLPVDAVVIEEKGKNIGQPYSRNRYKVVKKQLATFDLNIRDEQDTYHPKDYKLTISQDNVGMERTIKLAPKVSYRFDIVDNLTSKPIANAKLKRFDESLGTSNAMGQISDKLVNENREQLKYTFSVAGYRTVDVDLPSPQGRVGKTIQLERFYATVSLQNSNGDPLSGIIVGLKSGEGEKTNSFGEAKVFPGFIDKEYTVYTTDPKSLSMNAEEKILFSNQAQRYAIALDKQPWVHLQIFQQMNDYKQPLENVQINAGKTAGKSDMDGIYRFKVTNRFAAIKLVIAKKGYISSTVEVTPVGQLTTQEVFLKRLQARLVVLDSRTQKPVGNLVVSVNGERASQTNPQSGAAEIFPDESPSTLNIMIASMTGEYQSLRQKVDYSHEQRDLGVFRVIPKPIAIDVSLKWAETGLPVTGTLEIDMPFDLYELTSIDQGRHSFEYFDRHIKPNLTIRTQAPGSGMAFERSFPIQFTRGAYQVEIIDILRPIPYVKIEVDPSTRVSIQSEATGEIEVSLNEGTFEGELSNFGAYNIILSGANYPTTDTIPEYIDKAMTVFDLRPPKGCLDIADAYLLDSLGSYIDLVENLSENVDCYCDENQRAARVSIQAGDYYRAVEFINKVASATKMASCSKQWKSPYLRLWSLQSYVEINRTDNLIRASFAYDELNQRVQLLPDRVRTDVVCKANYFYGMILYKTVQKYQERVKSTRGSERDDWLEKRNEAGEQARAFLDLYQINKSNCGYMLQHALEDVKIILTTFRI